MTPWRRAAPRAGTPSWDSGPKLSAPNIPGCPCCLPLSRTQLANQAGVRQPSPACPVPQEDGWESTPRAQKRKMRQQGCRGCPEQSTAARAPPSIRAAVAITGCVILDPGCPHPQDVGPDHPDPSSFWSLSHRARKAQFCWKSARGCQCLFSPQRQSFPEPEAPPHKGHSTQARQASIPPGPRLGRQTAHNQPVPRTLPLTCKSCTTPRAHRNGLTHNRHTLGTAVAPPQMQTHTQKNICPPTLIPCCGHHHRHEHTNLLAKPTPSTHSSTPPLHTHRHHIVHTGTLSAILYTDSYTRLDTASM